MPDTERVLSEERIASIQKGIAQARVGKVTPLADVINELGVIEIDYDYDDSRPFLRCSLCDRFVTDLEGGGTFADLVRTVQAHLDTKHGDSVLQAAHECLDGKVFTTIVVDRDVVTGYAPCPICVVP